MINLTDIQPQKDEIYLDNNATTPVLPQAAEAAIHTMNLCYGNPSSSHMTGVRAKYILESTRKVARQVIGATDGEIIFTSGATEGIQTSIISALNEARNKVMNIAEPVLLYGATEHKAVPETLKHWNQMLNVGAKVVSIPVDENGILDFDFIKQHVPNALMICTMAANNETGVFQDLPALEHVIRSNNPEVLWMVDSVQALGKINLELSKTTIDYAPFSGHKLYGPKGVGVLYVRQSAPYTPFIAGGGQESGLRSGTENLPGIAALNAIFNLLNDEHDDTFKSHAVLVSYRQQLENTLRVVFPAIVFNHNFAHSLPTTLNFSVKGLSSKDIMDLFDAARIRVSSGSACSSKVAGSFVLDAMHKPAWQSEGAIRMSFGPATTQADIDKACTAITKAVTALRNSCLILSDTDEYVESITDGLQQWVYDEQCTWCYISKATKEILLIDPVPELVNKFETLVNCQDYIVKAILATHKHDQQLDCPEMIRNILSDKLSSQQYDCLGWDDSLTEQVYLDNGMAVNAITIGDKVIAKLALPGHTNNSVGYLFGRVENSQLSANNIEYCFIGDTLQIGGIGRSDFACSDSGVLFHSLLLLAKVIADNTLICPAHDYQQLFNTSLALETQSNSLLADALAGKVNEQQFIKAKQVLDSQDKPDAQAAQCGNIKQNIDSSIDVEPNEFSQFLADNPDVMVVDVREAHEFEAHRQEYIREQKIMNVPLTQLTHFIQNHQHDKNLHSYVCICRSGGRSDAAAKTLKRMGFEHVYHVPGGFSVLNN